MCSSDLGLFSGTDVLDSTGTFFGTEFTVGSAVTTKFDLNVASVVYESALITAEDVEIGLEFTLELGVAFTDSSFEIESATEYARKDLSETVPLLGGRVRFDVTKWLRAEVEVRWVSIAHDGVSLRYVDSALEFLAFGGDNVFGGFGYHYVKVAGTDARDPNSITDFDFKIDGMYLTAGFRF